MRSLLGTLRGGTALQQAWCLGWSSGGLRAGCGRLSAPHTESPSSCQMRLLLVKQGSSLPLYLRLVTDHLRLYTLYEQVG